MSHMSLPAPPHPPVGVGAAVETAYRERVAVEVPADLAAYRVQRAARPAISATLPCHPGPLAPPPAPLTGTPWRRAASSAGCGTGHREGRVPP